MMEFFLALFVIGIIGMGLVVWAACVAAGRADDDAEWMS
jgi:hypothetical protein